MPGSARGLQVAFMTLGLISAPSAAIGLLLTSATAQELRMSEPTMKQYTQKELLDRIKEPSREEGLPLWRIGDRHVTNLQVENLIATECKPRRGKWIGSFSLWGTSVLKADPSLAAQKVDLKALETEFRSRASRLVETGDKKKAALVCAALH